MDDIEIDLMKRFLEMNPYKRITATQAIRHCYFDDIRAKDPDYSRATSNAHR